LQRNPLGQILIQKGVPSPHQLQLSFESQKKSNNRLAPECKLLELASEENLLRGLSSHLTKQNERFALALIIDRDSS
jgi:hypothetical protein